MSAKPVKRRAPLYTAMSLPVFQNRMFDSVDDARNSPVGNVVLVQDQQTGLVFNEAFDPELVRYDQDYQNEQAESAVFRKHLENVAAIIGSYFPRSSVVEIGCGKGYFLELLQRLRYDISGYDPAYEGSNSAIVRDYYTAGSGVRADAVILRHVLEHIPDPLQFLSEIRDGAGVGARIYIEVPCLDWILERRAWFDIYYEHVNYFRLDDLRNMFGSVCDAGHVFGGQYIYVVAELDSLRRPEVQKLVRFPDDFLDGIDRFALALRGVGGESRRLTAVWGGASKGVILALFMMRALAPVDMIVDINSAKQGRYVPGTGLRVRSPKEAMDLLTAGSDVLVMNENYLHEIRNITENRFNYISVSRG